MSNPRAFRATLHTISDALKSQSGGSFSKTIHPQPTSPLSSKFPSRTQTPFSHSRSTSTVTSHSSTSSPLPGTSPMDTVPISSKSNSSPSPGMGNIPRSRSISHNSHIRRPSVAGSPPCLTERAQTAQLVSIYDKPAWSGEPRQQSIVDLAASESHSSEAQRPRSGTSKHPAMTVHIYDGPSCP